MIGKLFRWFRRTLPPMPVIVLVVFAFLCVQALYYLSRWYVGVGVSASTDDFPAQMSRMRIAITAVILAAYAGFRVIAFHPVFRPKYRSWLQLTPWGEGKPLPLGPIHLIWQDVLIVGIFLLTLHDSGQGSFAVLDAFLFAYLGILGLTFFWTGPWWLGYLVFFGLGLAIRMTHYPLVCLAIHGVNYLAAYIGCRIALKRFPWSLSKSIDVFKQAFTTNNALLKRPISVWPFNQLLEAPKANRVNHKDGFLAPLLIAWWLYAMISVIPCGVNPMDFLAFLLFITTMGAFLARVMIYCGSYWPPISLWGRLITLRWIIPGYDRIWIAPIYILLTAMFGGYFAVLAGSDYRAVTFPLVIAAVLIVALNSGPSLKKWQLTGHHRMNRQLGSNDPNRVKL